MIQSMKRIALFIFSVLCFGAIGATVYNLDPFAIDAFGFGIFYFVLTIGFFSLFMAIGFKKWQIWSLVLIILVILILIRIW